MSIAKNNKWPSKRAGEVDYRGINWTNELEGAETIASESYTAATGGTVTLGAVTKSGKITKVEISGGTADTVDSVVGSITTSTGRILEVEMFLPIT